MNLIFLEGGTNLMALALSGGGCQFNNSCLRAAASFSASNSAFPSSAFNSKSAFSCSALNSNSCNSGAYLNLASLKS